MNSVIVIGAGAAGMTAAIYAARQGSKVIILEHTSKAGKKILSTGNGKCNITNTYQQNSCYRGNHSEFAMEVLGAFGVEATLEFMKSIGIFTKNKNGYIYPRSEQAATVLECLLMELEHLNVEIIYDVQVTSIEKQQEQFQIITNQPEKTYKCHKLIFATGSKAAPNTGSDGSGYELAKKMGHKIIKPLPALVQLKCEEGIYKEAAGVRCEAIIKIVSNGEEIASEQGELQITNYGISGIPVMQLSRYAVKELDIRKDVWAVIDFLPEFTYEQLCKAFTEQINRFPYRTVEEVLNGFLNKKLSSALLREMGIKKRFLASKCSKEDISVIVEGLKAFETRIIGSNSFKEAQVCQGGVSTLEVDVKTMESKKCAGLYFAGEILDIDGTCGGYNLQFAWGTGAIAGKYAGK